MAFALLVRPYNRAARRDHHRVLPDRVDAGSARAAPSRYRRSATPSTATRLRPEHKVTASTENAPDVRAVASSSAGRSDPSWPFSNSSAKRETSSSNARLATSCTVTNTSLTTEHGKMLGTASLTLSASWEPERSHGEADSTAGQSSEPSESTPGSNDATSGEPDQDHDRCRSRGSRTSGRARRGAARRGSTSARPVSRGSERPVAGRITPFNPLVSNSAEPGYPERARHPHTWLVAPGTRWQHSPPPADRRDCGSPRRNRHKCRMLSGRSFQRGS